MTGVQPCALPISANDGISLFVVGMALTARAKATLFKGATMALFGTWVIGSAVYRAMTGSAPDPSMMGAIALLALVVNVAVAFLLYRYRDGGSNKQSIWLCSRNDAIGNVAVMIAASGVWASQTAWPDLVVAGVMAGLFLWSATQIILQALREGRQPASHPVEEK